VLKPTVTYIAGTNMEHDHAYGAERRANADLAGAVEDCLVLQRTLGADAARQCLEARQIPEHIILRVMACAAFRRLPCNNKSRNGFVRPLSSVREDAPKRV
jgi:hypothetical protein